MAWSLNQDLLGLSPVTATKHSEFTTALICNILIDSVVMKYLSEAHSFYVGDHRGHNYRALQQELSVTSGISDFSQSCSFFSFHQGHKEQGDVGKV